MKPDEKIENISDCFQNLKNEDIKFLENKKTKVEYLKGETIFKQGVFAPHIYFICQGLVIVYFQTGKGKQINIKLAKRGDFIALSSVFNKNTYQYSAFALTDATICILDKNAIKELIAKNPYFAIQIISKNSNNELRYLDIIKNLSYKQMRGKLASAILYLTSSEFIDFDVFNNLTRQNLADFASISMESTVKFLKEFEKENIIKTNGREITIINREALSELDIKA